MMLVACASFKLIIAFEFTMLPPPPSFCSSQVIGLERGGERYPIMIMISIAYDISSHVLIIKSLYPTYHIPQLPLSPPSPPSTLHPPLPFLAFMHYHSHSNSNSQIFFFLLNNSIALTWNVGQITFQIVFLITFDLEIYINPYHVTII